MVYYEPMHRPSDYSCPECGSYLRDDERNQGWKKCHCGFRRKTLEAQGRETPPKPKPEPPLKTKKR